MSSYSFRDEISKQEEVDTSREQRRESLFRMVREKWGLSESDPLLVRGSGKDWLREVYGIDRVRWYCPIEVD